MKKFLLLLFVLLTAISCEITLDGNRFYTVEGKLLDTLNQPINEHQLQVTVSQYGLFTYNESVVLNNCKTDANGYFKMNFPGSNSFTYLHFEPNFYKYDSISSDGHYYGYHTEIQLDDNYNLENNFDLGTINLKKNN